MLTPIEELQYLASLSLEASKWRVSEGDTRSGLEMEVEDRLARLQEQLSTPQPQPEPHNKNPSACTGKNIAFNGSKSQMFAAYKSL